VSLLGDGTVNVQVMKSCRRVEVQDHSLLGHAVALRYKPEGRGIDPRRGHRDFSSIQSFQPHCGPGADSACDINEYQEYFLGVKGGRCVGLTTLPPSCDECLEIWESQPPGTLKNLLFILHLSTGWR